jgi:hypothetical protein
VGYGFYVGGPWSDLPRFFWDRLGWGFAAWYLTLLLAAVIAGLPEWRRRCELGREPIDDLTLDAESPRAAGLSPVSLWEDATEGKATRTLQPCSGVVDQFDERPGRCRTSRLEDDELAAARGEPGCHIRQQYA